MLGTQPLVSDYIDFETAKEPVEALHGSKASMTMSHMGFDV